MSIFDTRDIQNTAGTNVTPQAGVAKDVNPLLGAAGDVARLGEKVYNKFAEADAQAQAQKSLSSLAKKFSDVDAAIANNKLTASQGKAKKRTLLLQGVQSGLDTTSLKGLMGVGFGGEEDFVDPQAKLEDDLISQAQTAGEITSDMTTREAKLEAANNYARGRQALTRLERNQKEQTFEKGGLELDKAIRQREDIRSVKEFAASYTKTQSNKLNAIFHDLNQAGNTREASAQALNAINSLEAQFNSNVAAIGPESGEVLGRLSSPVTMQFDLAKKRLSGEITREVSNAYSQNAIAWQKANALEDGSTQRLAAMEQLFPTIATTALRSTNAINFVTQNHSKFNTKPVDIIVTPEEAAIDPEAKSNAIDYMNLVNDMGDKALNRQDKPSTEQKQQDKVNVSNQVNGVLNAATKYSTGNPAEAFDFVNFLADDRFIQTSEKLGNLIKPEYRAAAQDQLKSYYSWTAGIVSKNLDSATVNMSGKSVPLLEVVTPVIVSSPNGPTVDFRPKAGVTIPVMSKKDVDQLQRRVGRILGNAVRAGAHLEGNRDYKGFLERNFTPIFGVKKDDKAE